MFESYTSVIKNHIWIQKVIDKLDNDEYQNHFQFKLDIDIMWENMEIFFGEKI